MAAIVSTKNGLIQGLKKVSKLGTEYFSFQGIPYAKPPVGALRFKPPVPVEPWNGVLEAVSEKPVPHYVESHFKGLEVSEDCLYLNVYSKTMNEDKKPVLVFIYGGGFSGGSSTTKMYGPDFLMQENVILVTFNYRLCIFGHLAFKDPSLGIPGNAFLKDQRLALKWIKENIEAFGGDPENITVFGHSAGGMSLHLHLMSPSCEGLFHRAALLAGTALLPQAVIPMIPLGERLATQTGWNGEGGEREIYEHLMSLDAETLTQASGGNLLTGEERMQGYISAFTPLIEPYETEDSFCTLEPLQAMRNCWGNNVDAVFWYSSNELILGLKAIKQLAAIGTIPDGIFLPHEVKINKSEAELKKAIKSIKALYDLDSVSSDNVQPLIDYKNDELFFHSTHRTILSRLKHSTKKTYMGYFDLDSETFNHHKICVFNGKRLRGAAHGDELSYIFSNEFGPLPSTDSVEFKNVLKMVDFLVGFAREGHVQMEKISWKPVRKEDLPHSYEALLIRNEEWKMGTLPEASRLPAWDKLYDDRDLI